MLSMTDTADVAQMNLVEPDLDTSIPYQDGGPKSFAPPPEGKYTARVPVITDSCFGVTQAGFLKVELPPLEIVTPGPGLGYNVRFARLSAKRYVKRNGSQILDFLRSCGYPTVPKTNAEIKIALKAVSGKLCNFGLVWEAYNKNTQEEIKGYESFPPDPANPGKRLPFVEDETETVTLSDGSEKPKRWYANGRVRYWIAATQNNGQA